MLFYAEGLKHEGNIRSARAMAILDSKGRLFGKISLLDIGAGLIILMVAVAVFFYPGTSGSVAQVGAINKDIEDALSAMENQRNIAA